MVGGASVRLVGKGEKEDYEVAKAYHARSRVRDTSRRYVTRQIAAWYMLGTVNEYL